MTPRSDDAATWGDQLDALLALIAAAQREREEPPIDHHGDRILGRPVVDLPSL